MIIKENIRGEKLYFTVIIPSAVDVPVKLQLQKQDESVWIVKGAESQMHNWVLSSE